MSEVTTRTEFIQTRGLRFEVVTAGSGDKLALCLHGFPESAYSWRHQIPALVRLGYRVWAPNLRGYGHTDRPIGTAEYRIDKLEQDVADLIDASGAREVVLVSHDWGGVIAWSFAQHHPDKIARLIVMNAPHPARFEHALRTVAQLQRSWYVFFFQLPRVPEWVLGRNDAEVIGRMFRDTAIDKSRFPDEVVRVFKDNAEIPGALTAMVAYYRAIPLAFRLARTRGQPVITTPTLLIWGEADVALGLELTEGLERWVTNLTVKRLANVSHWVQQEAPEAVNAAVESWLSTPTA